MNFKPLADNVLIEMLPREAKTASGIELVHLGGPKAREHRKARVLAVGPGHYGKATYLNPQGLFHPTTVKPGEVVIVDALCGDRQNWSSFDVGEAPRTNNENARVGSVDGERADYRVIREAEVLAVVEEEEEVAAAE